MDIVEKAKQFATEAHNSINHIRKYSGEPYIVHPQNVVRILSGYTNDPEVLAAAWLHDVMEDVQVSETRLQELFGIRVTQMIQELTSPSKVDIPNREERKRVENAKIKNISKEAKLIKLADILDNTSDVRENDPAFAYRYLNEKLMQLESLKDVNPEFWSRVHEQLSQELSLLNAIV